MRKTIQRAQSFQAELSFRFLIMVALWGTMILTPFRLRFFIFERPKPPIYSDFTDFILFASDTFMVLTLVLWLISVLFKSRPVALGPSFLTVPIAGITLAGLVSIPFSMDAPLSLYHFLRILLLFGFYLFVNSEIRSLKAIVIPIGIQIFIQSLIAVLQILGQRSIGLASLGELELDPAWSGVSIVWAEGIRSLRAYGLTDHPNILGGCLAFGLIIIASYYITPHAKWRTIFAAVFGLGALALFYTFSRAAWLATSVGLVFISVWLLKRKQVQKFGTLLGLLAGVLILAAPFVWHNLPYLGVRLNFNESFTRNSHESQAINERLILNRLANDIFLSKPLTGVGVGAFPIALQAYEPDYLYNYQPAHIVLLDAAAETGIFGGMFYLFAISSPWIAMWLRRKRLRFTNSLIGASSLLLAITLVGLFDYYTWLLTPGRLWQWLVWGLWAAIYNHSRPEDPHA